MPEYTQATRALAVTTALGTDKLIAVGLEAQEAISQPFHFSLELFSAGDPIKPTDVLGTEMCVTIRRDGEDARWFHGIVRRFTHEPHRAGEHSVFRSESLERSIRYYRAEIVPWFWLLKQSRDCRIFQQKSIPDIIKMVFKDFGLQNFKIDLNQSYAELDFCVQYRETAFDFVSRLMEENGIFYFFVHTEKKHTMVLADSTSAWSKLSVESLSCRSSAAEPILSWAHDYNFTPGSWTYRDFNFETPSLDLTTTEPTTLDIKETGGFEEFDYPGRYGVTSDGRQLNRTRAEAREAGYHAVRGESLCPLLVPGGRFALADNWDEAENGKSYAIASVRHTVTQPVYMTGDETGEPYRNTFEVFPVETTYRAPRNTPRPLVQGPQTAIVVGPAGEEIYTDKYGRVKVQFHWDREGKRDENSSCWVRVSQVWAGAGWGAIQIPRIGQEVIVDFLEGDPDRPIITGRVYNAEQMPPHALPGAAVKSGLKSNSTKGGGGSNELTFDDTKGTEKVYFHAQYDHEVVIENDETRTVVNGNRILEIKSGTHTETIEGNTSISIKVGSYNHEVIANTSLRKAQGRNVLESDTEIELKVGASSLVMKNDGTITLKGVNITVDGSATVTVKGAPITLNP